MLIAGIDEAGYGPLLGPLVVSAAAFRFPEPLDITDITPAQKLWTRLAAAVVSKPSVKSGKLMIADSKVVHRLSEGDRHLERAVLAMQRLIPGAGDRPEYWNDLLARLSISRAGTPEPSAALPWKSNLAIPAFSENGTITIAANMLQGAIRSGNTPPAGLWARVLDVPEYNRMVSATNNKASVLTSITMMHARNLHDRFHESDLLLFVDKQGGRDNYTRLLINTFPQARKVRFGLGQPAHGVGVITGGRFEIRNLPPPPLIKHGHIQFPQIFAYHAGQGGGQAMLLRLFAENNERLSTRCGN